MALNKVDLESAEASYLGIRGDVIRGDGIW